MALHAEEPELGRDRAVSAGHDRQLEDATRTLLALEQVECVSRYSVVGGRRLHYLEAGSGPALVLLHGASGGGANWYRLIRPLSERWRVLAPDLPGFGFSDPIEPVAPLGQTVARVISEWLSSLGIDATHAVGTSFGGIVALRLPDVFTVRRLIAIDTVGLASHVPVVLRLATLPLLSRFAVRPTRRGTRLLLRRVLTHAPLPPAHEAALTNYLYLSAARGDLQLMARAFMRFAGIAGQREVLSEGELSRVATRLLVVWGEQDEFLPRADAERMCALAGCPPVRIIPGAGHSPNWEQPGKLLNVITDYLANE